jgi:LemA protein
MKQEQTIFTAIAEARTRYTGAQSGSVEDRVKATAGLDSALARLLVITENYPQLKSSENVQTLMAQLEGTENRIAVARGRFNESVQSYNLVVKRAPSSIIASLFGFAEKSYFQADAAAATAPKVSL